MRVLTLTLLALLLLLQWSLWLGKGSWLRVWQLDSQLTTLRASNDKLVTRNLALAAEVSDLKQGSSAIEERARSELGMIKKGEVFFQLLEPHAALPAAPAAQSGATAPPPDPADDVSLLPILEP